MANNVIEFSLKAVDEFSGQFNKLRGKIDAVAKTAAVAATAMGAGLAAASKSIIEVGSETENLRIRLNALLGSVGEGNKAFQQMSEFASTVPFAYREIMDSATTLAGIVEGGADEIASYMPMITDLATVSGLSIKETTGQVVRMFSAGAGAADLFRERGVLNMLGFEAGVSVSAEETKRRLISAFEDPQSKFAGASKEMATTWDGVMSMIGDKWFNFQKQIADSGIFNYFKAIAMNIDKLMGDSLGSVAENAKSVSNFIINSIRGIMDAVGVLANAWAHLNALYDMGKLIFAQMAEYIIGKVAAMAEGAREFLNIFGFDIEPFEQLNATLEAAQVRTNNVVAEMEHFSEALPSESLAEFMDEVDITFAELETKSAEMAEAVAAPAKTAVEGTFSLMEQIRDAYPTFLTDMQVETEKFGENFFDVMNSGIDSLSNAMGEAIVNGENLSKAFQKVAKKVLSDIVSMLIKVGIQRLILSKTMTTTAASENATLLGGGFANTFTNAYASTAAIPVVGPALAPAAAAQALAAVSAGSAGAAAAGIAMGSGIGAAGIAHGGLGFVPKEATYLLDRGERVLSPNQNRDLTDFISGEGGGGVTINEVNISVLPNATNADALLEMDQDEMDELVAGPIIESLNRLRDRGISPNFVERES